jgi:hypothetical protein
LHELEFDHAMGKLDADDYRVLRHRLVSRALAGMGRQEKKPGLSSPDRVAQVAESSRSMATAPNVTVNFCPQCGMRFENTHNFCPNCGAGLAVRAPTEMR